MKTLLSFCTTGFVLIVTSAQAAVLTGPIVNPANGHSYYLLEQDTWTNSEAEAVTLGGHLVTINDSAENQWVFDTFENFGGVRRNLWIGLNDIDTEGTFVWTSGEPVTYTNWSTGQPDNVNGNQDAALIISSVNPFLGSLAQQWDDGNPEASTNGSPFAGVVEVVPEPSSFALLGLGSMALLRRWR